VQGDRAHHGDGAARASSETIQDELDEKLIKRVKTNDYGEDAKIALEECESQSHGTTRRVFLRMARKAIEAMRLTEAR
jgi:hypothetical protein